jgi:predicted NBD/HSP70 family sugar kinase
MSLDIPKKFHEALKPFLEKELNIDVKLENDVAVIALSPAKTFRHAENTPDKTPSETS